MNDLNSIYLVGRIKGEPKIKDYVCTLSLVNNRYQYTDKEYVNVENIFTITIAGKENEKVFTKLKDGMRIGVNGHLEDVNSKISIYCFITQILDPNIYK